MRTFGPGEAAAIHPGPKRISYRYPLDPVVARPGGDDPRRPRHAPVANAGDSPMFAPLLAELFAEPGTLALYGLLGLVGVLAFIELCGLRIIPNDKVGVVENLWSPKGSIGDGRIIALGGEAGYQVDLLRGGVHFGLWRWKYRIHKVGLVTVPQGQLAYVYARDGEPLPPSQTLGRVVPCNNFQDARAFLIGTPLPESAAPGESAFIPAGQRGRQP